MSEYIVTLVKIGDNCPCFNSAGVKGARCISRDNTLCGDCNLIKDYIKKLKRKGEKNG